MMNFKELQDKIDGSFVMLDNNEAEGVNLLVANHHIRNCKTYDDGSMGEIRITPKQLKDLIAYAGDKLLLRLLTKI